MTTEFGPEKKAHIRLFPYTSSGTINTLNLLGALKLSRYKDWIKSKTDT